MQTLRVNGVQESPTREYHWLFVNTYNETIEAAKGPLSNFNAALCAFFDANAYAFDNGIAITSALET